MAYNLLKRLRAGLIHHDHLISAEIISALSIHLTLLKTWNRIYKFWVRPELQNMICLDLLTTALLQLNYVISCHKRLTG